MPIINGSSIADILHECEINIDGFLGSYNFSATLNLESQVAALPAKLSRFDPDILLRFAQSNIWESSLRSPFRETMTFIDARGQEMEIPLSCCVSYQDFQIFLVSMVYRVGSKTPPIRGASYMELTQYLLTCYGHEIRASRPEVWSLMLKFRGPLKNVDYLTPDWAL